MSQKTQSRQGHSPTARAGSKSRLFAHWAFEGKKKILFFFHGENVPEHLLAQRDFRESSLGEGQFLAILNF